MSLCGTPLLPACPAGERVRWLAVIFQLPNSFTCRTTRRQGSKGNEQRHSSPRTASPAGQAGRGRHPSIEDECNTSIKVPNWSPPTAILSAFQKFLSGQPAKRNELNGPYTMNDQVWVPCHGMHGTRTRNREFRTNKICAFAVTHPLFTRPGPGARVRPSGGHAQ